MIDLSTELTGLVRLHDQLAARHNGVVIAFMGVSEGCGVSTCARAFARLMTPRLQRGVWLVDLDFYANSQYQALCSPAAQAFYGATGPAWITPEGEPLFWRVHPALVHKDGAKAAHRYYLNIHRIGAHALYVSRFRHDLLRQGQQVTLHASSAFWRTMRSRAALTIIDAPPLQRGGAGLITAPDADGVVIVAHPAQAGAPVQQLRRRIEGRGGRVLGVLYNEAPALAQRGAATAQS